METSWEGEGAASVLIASSVKGHHHRMDSAHYTHSQSLIYMLCHASMFAFTASAIYEILVFSFDIYVYRIRHAMSNST